MNRLAIFVEGYTEAVFVERLLFEIAGENKVHIEHREIRGGKNVRRTMRLIRARNPGTGQEFFVLLVDCGNDRLVKERIREEHQRLTRKGYKKIIGIRDVRPDFTYADIPKLEKNLPKYIKTSLAPVQFILSIMEIEAWFLAETTHFARIAPGITLDAIKANLSFDPKNDDMQQRPTPASDLNDCYAIGGRAYTKGAAQTTVDALDYTQVYMQLFEKFPYLKELICCIDAFLAESVS